MKKYCTLISPLIFLLPICCFTQPSLPGDYFRSATTGDWTALPTWQSSHDNIIYFAATLTPTSTAASILIQNLHTVTISGSGISLINTTIQNGGTLEITSTSNYTIDGIGDNLVVENGAILLLNFTTLSALSGLGTALIKTGGKVVANAVSNAANAKIMGDNYLNINSKFTYEDKSIFEWKIANAILPSNNNDQYFKTPLPTDLPILRISTTPVPAYGTSNNDNIFNSILEVNASITFATNGTKSFLGGLSGTGTINQSGGAIILPTSTSVLDGSITINIESSGLRFINGAIISFGANVKITAPSENDQINKQGGNLQINGTLDITNCRVSNTAGTSPSVTIATGGVLKTSNSGGFSGVGAAIVAEPIILETNSTIEFNRAGDQNFNPRTDFKNLTFSGSGIKKPGSGFDPVGTVKITGNAILDCTGHNVGDGSTNANLTMDGGRLIVSTGSTQPRMGGVYNLTGGVVEFAGSGSQSIRTQTYQNIEVTGIGVGNSSGNITLNSGGIFSVKSTGVFEINSDGIVGPSGVQTVTIENGGIFKCGDKDGFSGNSGAIATSVNQDIENITLHPGSTVDYSRSNDQVITNAHTYQNLIISGTTGIKTAPSGTLTILGNFTKSGTSDFAHNNGTVIFTNTITGQDYNCTSPTPVSFYNLTINNSSAGVNVINNMDIVNALNLSDNSTLNCTTGDITLLSTASTTARVAEIPATASITYGVTTGRFYVERFFPNSNPVSHRAWRLVTAPLIETGTIYDTWQLGGAIYGPGNYHRGTLITGPQIAGNGLDFTPTNNYSLKKFNGTNFIGVDNTHVPLSPAIGTGYFLFVRGDRNPILTNIANSDYTTLSSSGKLHTGPVNITVPGSYGLVGNPYASPVDFNVIDKSDNIYPHRFYIFDPTINQVGAYVTMEDLATPGIFIPTAPYGGSSQDNYIQSSQAFFVERITPAAASVTFQESNKASFNNPLIFRPASALDGNREFIRTNLHLLNDDSSKSIADGCLVEFSNLYSLEVDIKDAIKFGNVNETFSLAGYNKKMAVERRPLVTEKDTLFYHLTRTSKRNYQFEFIANINANGLEGYLEDSYSKSSIMVNLSGTTHINFAVNEDTLSAAATRFKLVFKNSEQFLPLTYNGAGAIRIYPNPVTDGTVNLQLIDKPEGKYIVRLLNNIGQVLFIQFINHSGGDFKATINSGLENLNAGIYQLEVILPDKSKRNIKVLVQTK